MCTRSVVFGSLLIIGVLSPAWGEEVSDLRLVPMPKQVALQQGAFSLDRPLVLEVPKQAAGVTARAIADEFRRAKLPVPQVRQTDSAEPRFLLFSRTAGSIPLPKLRREPTSEDYTLRIAPGGITCGAADWPGLFYGVQTLCQLIRANRRDNSLPCLTISDWPSLRWRCFQDDMTRGPSSTLATLKQHVELGSALKMNLFTYYMEYQFAFKKHPVIGPKDGSLEPDDLRALVEYAKQYHTDVLGNQQSFAHFAHILSHPEYADLRETPYLLTPANEKTYELLDDLYSEVCPLLPFPWFNVCCDETWGLGNGPSKPLAEKIGTGAVYVQHVARVHKMLKEKYDKRMMMWGDIILQHPDHLEKIPKDTIMLTWGYSAKESFDDQIVPFARSGYEFFVCPGINNWSRILPDFGVTTTNIHHFVRDGVEHGALGMLNTAWEDDGEALQGYKWHGYAWGAECAWTGSTTTPEDFNRRIGAVLFGERGDHFGQAIELLAQTHRLPGMNGMNNRRFWQDDWQLRAAPASVRKTAAQLLELVCPAIEHLEACKAEATANAKLLDYFLFGARRMELIGLRMIDRLEAGRMYAEASRRPPAEALPLVLWIIVMVDRNRREHQALGEEFSALWLAESKPYLLDKTLGRYAAVTDRFDLLTLLLESTHEFAKMGDPLPPAELFWLDMPEIFARRTRPHQVIAAALESDLPWAEPKASHRLALVVEAGSVDRFDLPVR
ncbi:MAG: beta-N-acetylhexosaminidase, partial [Planctomycetes bacterium]|nr:beta-N-acetylhexosaminidase [Planctomycetota bacterium]